MTILVFAPHSDDEVIGLGGTIAKYTKEGQVVILVVFSYGEGSDPLKKEQITLEARKKEAEKVRRFLGIKKTIFLGMPDTKFWIFSRFKVDNDLIKKIKDIINEHNPELVFIPASSETHQDHRKVHKLLMKILKDRKVKIYSYFVLTALRLFNTDKPKLYVDITDTFAKKIKALHLFKSQYNMYIDPLMPSIRLKAVKAGLDINCKYAEVFLKLK